MSYCIPRGESGGYIHHARADQTLPNPLSVENYSLASFILLEKNHSTFIDNNNSAKKKSLKYMPDNNYNYNNKMKKNIDDSAMLRLKVSDIPIDWNISIFQENLPNISLFELKDAPSEEEIINEIWSFVDSEIENAIGKILN